MLHQYLYYLTMDRKYVIGITAISLSFLALRYFTLHSKGRAKKDNQPNLVRSQTLDSIVSEQLDQLSILQEMLVHKSSQFDIKYLPQKQNILTSNCTLLFLKSTYDLFERKEIESIYQRSRKARRRIFSDIENQYEVYFRFVCTLEQQIKHLIEKVQRDFVTFLGIDYSVITSSIEYHMSKKKFREDLANWTCEIREIIKNQLPLYDKPIQPDLAHQIMIYQIQLLTQKAQKIKNIVLKIGIHLEEQIQCLPTFLTCYLEDSVFQKFKIENQQISSEESGMSVQLYQKMKEFSEGQKTVMSQLYSAVKDDIVNENY